MATVGRELAQIIDGDGNFNDAGVESFIKKVKLAECGLSYAVVSVMGPQSGGKSTLLNNLFQTDFTMMDGTRRKQTTKGIWIASSIGMKPCTLVMDLEGSDGRERGEDDTTFEKQSALFALAVSDVVIINMWCTDIGRVQAGSWPLLRNVFQVMMRLFGPRKITLMFVIRDYDETPLESLELDLLEDINKIWDSLKKPAGLEERALRDFFNIEIITLHSYKSQKEVFKKEVDDLRKRFVNSIAPGGLAGDRQGVVPASEFCFSTQQMWKVIKKNEDFNLPAHRVMVATIRCEKIGHDKYCQFLENEEWREIETAAQSHPVQNFGERLNAILNLYLSEYDAETSHLDEGVRIEKRKLLEEKLLQLVQPCCQLIAGHYELKLKEALDGPVREALHNEANDETWPKISKLYKRETETATAELSSTISGFKMDEETKEKMFLKLQASATELVESIAKTEATVVRELMNSRFVALCSRDSKEDIQAITRTAYSSCLKMLSVLAAVRLHNEKDSIEDELSIALISNSNSSSPELLASSTWDDVPPSRTLLTPIQCNTLWLKFMLQRAAVTQYIVDQEANKRNRSRLPPLWAVAAIAVLGFNEFMVLLRNPVYLAIIFIGYLLLRALWVQLDVSNEFRHGALPGLISLLSKLLPTIMNLLNRLVQEGCDQTKLPYVLPAIEPKAKQEELTE